jgi:hypothetical protein
MKWVSGVGSSPEGKAARGERLIAQLHLMSVLRMHGVSFEFPIHLHGSALKSVEGQLYLRLHITQLVRTLTSSGADFIPISGVLTAAMLTTADRKNFA